MPCLAGILARFVSFAAIRFGSFFCLPTACTVGCNLSLLRSCGVLHVQRGFFFAGVEVRAGGVVEVERADELSGRPTAARAKDTTLECGIRTSGFAGPQRLKPRLKRSRLTQRWKRCATLSGSATPPWVESFGLRYPIVQTATCCDAQLHSVTSRERGTSRVSETKQKTDQPRKLMRRRQVARSRFGKRDLGGL